MKNILFYVVFLSLTVISGCDTGNSDDTETCYADVQCITRMAGDTSENSCSDTNPLTLQRWNTPDVGCQVGDRWVFSVKNNTTDGHVEEVNFNQEGDCKVCNPKATKQNVSASLQNGDTCPVSTTHSSTFKTPGCWVDPCPIGSCEFCICGGGTCYSTITWTTTDYVTAPLYGSCP